MAINRRYSDKINNAGFEGNTNLTAAERLVQDDFNASGGLGSYQKTNVEDIVNNFLATHVGEDKVLKRVPKHEVEAWAQRAVQEFSYDILYSENSVEFEIGDRLSFPLPSDYVNYVKVSWTDSLGHEHTVHPARITTAKQAVLQDDNFNWLYDQDGERLLDNSSETIRRYQSNDNNFRDIFVIDSYYGDYTEDNYNYFYSAYNGGRFGIDPQFANSNGTFTIDTLKGMIHLDSSFARRSFSENDDGNDDPDRQTESIVSLSYVSDGLKDNADLSKVYMHKMAEDAVYSYLLYNLTKLRPSTVSLAPLYKKEADTKMRNAKVRLMNLKTEEMEQVFRGIAKWIKH